MTRLLQRDRNSCEYESCFILQLFVALIACLMSPGSNVFGDDADLRKKLLERLGVTGGLCVQVGAEDTTLAVELARTGRFLVHVLDRDATAVELARKRLHAKGLYGLISVDRLGASGKLPYTENLVNLAIINDQFKNDSELQRVVCPNGVVMAAEAMGIRKFDNATLPDTLMFKSDRDWIIQRKPWPREMDEWSHPRHAADGNAVSNDTVVGPPRRIRWLSGPWQEVSNMVSANGRNYYGGLLARDSFNGLRLWRKQLAPSRSRGSLSIRPTSDSAVPIAGDGRVFIFTDGKLQAVNGATGETIRDYAVTGKPRKVLYDDGVLIAVGTNGLQAFSADNGSVMWSHKATMPRYVVAGDDTVGLIQGSARSKVPVEVAALDKQTGSVKWKRGDLPWAAKASRCVYYKGMLTFEVSTFNDDGPGNGIHIVSADKGELRLDHDFLPGMNHRRQARAMYVNDTLWLLHGGKDANKKRLPTQISAIDFSTGTVKATHPAGLTHCFPPVATPNFLFSGELDLTDLRTGKLDANHITKAACGRDNGWVPANGLIYVTPKHCVCWPMLRGYSALAAARPGGNPALKKVQELTFALETDADVPSKIDAKDDDWPVYRHDAWRSGSTKAKAPSKLDTLWTVKFADGRKKGWPITEDWDENPFVKGPITPPVIANRSVYIARPDAHQVVAMNATNGEERWRFTANGRVDTPPTIHRGLVLFGTKSGWVYCVRADDGRLVWRLRAAPLDEQIVAYGGLESPWPVSGSVIVVDDVVYFAAGRQSLADGGILVFAVEPTTGKRRWVTRLNSVPQKGFYESSGLEFDNFDLLFRQGDSVAMSRWLFDRKTGKMTVNRWDAFAQLNTGGGSAMVPQGNWSYSPRNQKRTLTFEPLRPLVVFRDNVLFGCLESKQSIYRRDFDLDGGEEFARKWITGWAGSQGSRKGGLAWRSQRLAKGAKWTTDIYDEKKDNQTVNAMVLAGDQLLFAGSGGELRVVSTADGKQMLKREIPVPLWDGMAVASGKLFIATDDGQLICLGEN